MWYETKCLQNASVLEDHQMYKALIIALTLMMSGRAMTLAFIHRAGGDNPGDPPLAWLMPLLGDAVVGVAGLVVAWLLATGRGLLVWTVAIAWNVIGIWDALSAFVIHTTNPWPEFFMVQLFGGSMFFLASAMHLLLIVLLARPPARAWYLDGESVQTQGQAQTPLR